MNKVYAAPNVGVGNYSRFGGGYGSYNNAPGPPNRMPPTANELYGNNMSYGYNDPGNKYSQLMHKYNDAVARK